jgi:hypothetical protein
MSASTEAGADGPVRPKLAAAPLETIAQPVQRRDPEPGTAEDLVRVGSYD